MTAMLSTPRSLDIEPSHWLFSVERFTAWRESQPFVVWHPCLQLCIGNHRLQSRCSTTDVSQPYETAPLITDITEMHALVTSFAASTQLPIQITPAVVDLFKQHHLDHLLEKDPQKSTS